MDRNNPIYSVRSTCKLMYDYGYLSDGTFTIFTHIKKLWRKYSFPWIKIKKKQQLKVDGCPSPGLLVYGYMLAYYNFFFLPQFQKLCFNTWFTLEQSQNLCIAAGCWGFFVCFFFLSNIRPSTYYTNSCNVLSRMNYQCQFVFVTYVYTSI